MPGVGKAVAGGVPRPRGDLARARAGDCGWHDRKRLMHTESTPLPGAAGQERLNLSTELRVLEGRARRCPAGPRAVAMRRQITAAKCRLAAMPPPPAIPDAASALP